MRRLPIYFLLDVSESMLGENLYRLEEGLQRIIGELRTDPHALETAWVSVIAFAGRTREVVPLTELPAIHLPRLPVGGGTSLGRALLFLMDRMDARVRRADAEQKGDWKPIVFLITDGKPTDDVEPALARWAGYAARATLVAVSIGRSADLRVLNRLTDADKVLTLDDVSDEGFRKFIAWVTQAVQSRSRSVGDPAREERMPALDDDILRKLDLRKPIETVDETNAYFVSRCQNTRLPYVSRYEPLRDAFEIGGRPLHTVMYRLSGCYPVDGSYFEMTSEQPDVATLSSDQLLGMPGCPHCGNPVGFAMCSCGNTFCIPGSGEHTCPWCEQTGNFTQMDADAEAPEINRARG